jgi:methylenetetrahydrofolate dehydrogenase (NADP+)/methenyltetrahydrofolate cyclohydrolase
MILDGKEIAKSIEEKIRNTIQKSPSRRPPGLAFIQVGEDSSSRTYIKMKKRRCEEVGILSFDREFPETISEETLLEAIRALNQDPNVDGILVQLPLPPHLSPFRAMEAIDPKKDVDGFHPLNLGRILLGEPDPFYPCTPLGIVTLLHHYEIPISGKHVVIVGRSNIVGKPLAAMLMQKNALGNATVTIAHSATHHLPTICKSADILIAAIGCAECITADYVQPGAVVVDVGINRKEGKIVGDVDFQSVAPIASKITPVPGGIGPMTIAMLLSNTLSAYNRR